MNQPQFTIAAVERETGLSKDVLRMWERRYGFPTPDRDAHGERQYAEEQVGRLRQIKRLMDLGHRPGRLIALPPDELSIIASAPAAPEASPSTPDELGELIDLIRAHDSSGFLHALQHGLVRLGLFRFVLDIVAPLTSRVGKAWEAGHLQVFEEHLFTELTKRGLRQAISSLPRPASRPRVLLTTVPEEQHVIGLLMVEAVLSLDGAECVPLGSEMPLLDIQRAVQAYRADVVALSFSSAFPGRKAGAVLGELRRLLPTQVALWAGGSGIQRANTVDGVQLVCSLSGISETLNAWRAEHGVVVGKPAARTTGWPPV